MYESLALLALVALVYSFVAGGVERTDWGNLIPADKLPEELPEPSATGGAQPLFNRPDW